MIKLNIDDNTWREIENKHKEYLNEFISKRVNKLYNNKKYRDGKVRKKDILLLDRLFCSNGKKNINEKLEEICCNRNLENIIENFETNYYFAYKSKFSDDQRNNKINYRKVKKIINYIFDYQHFSNGHYRFNWNRHILITKLNVKVCPYCNRNYITSYYDEEALKNKTTADADHYYCQDLYPILALNIYNLVPSCQVCNSRMKGNLIKRKEDTHLYPYKDRSDSLYFTTPFSTIGELYNFKLEDIRINIDFRNELEKDHKRRAKKSKEIFKLDQVYQIHNDIVFDIKNKIKDYAINEEVFERFFKENYKGVFEDINEFKIFIFDFLQEDVESNTLVKLKQDIYAYIMSKII